MEIILLQQIAKLGAVGDVVKVKNGYARNFLLPQKMAIRANRKNIQEFEKMREIHEKNDALKRNEANAIAKQISKQDFIFIRQAGDAGQLYGSVSTRDIAAQIEDKGFKITRAQVILNTPIKTIGLYNIHINLHSGVQTDIRINVARSEEEAKKQKKGENILEKIQQKNQKNENQKDTMQKHHMQKQNENNKDENDKTKDAKIEKNEEEKEIKTQEKEKN